MNANCHPIKVLTLLFLIGIGAYFNSIFHPFVHDDVVFIQQNPFLSQWDRISDIFTRSHSFPGPEGSNLYYRPLLDLLYKFQFLLFGLNPRGYHLFNVMLHIANGILVFFAARLLLEEKVLALAVAVLFLVHPVQTESVACIAGVSNLFYSFGILVSFIFYMISRGKYAGRYSVLVYAASLVIFLIALLGKEQAIILPLLILLYDLCIPAKETWTKLNRILRLIGYFLVAMGYVLWRQMILGQAITSLGTNGQEIFLRIFSIPRIILTYGEILLFPVNLHYYRSVDILEPYLFPFVILIGITAGIIFLVRSVPLPLRRQLIFGMGWFLIALLPAVNIIPLIHEYSFISAAEHFLYLSIIGFLLFVLGLGQYYFKIIFKNHNPGKAIALMLVITIVLGAATIRQNRFWSSEIALFKRVLQFERLGRVHLLLGRAYYFDKQYENSIREYKAALEVMREYADKTRDIKARRFYLGFMKGIYFDLAHCYEAQEDLEQAVSVYISAHEIDPGDTVVLNNLSVCYLRLNQMDEAMRYLREILVTKPNDIMAMTNLALCHIHLEQFVEAEGLLRQALSIDGQFAPARQNLEQLLQRQKME